MSSSRRAEFLGHRRSGTLPAHLHFKKKNFPARIRKTGRAIDRLRLRVGYLPQLFSGRRLTSSAQGEWLHSRTEVHYPDVTFLQEPPLAFAGNWPDIWLRRSSGHQNWLIVSSIRETSNSVAKPPTRTHRTLPQSRQDATRGATPIFHARLKGIISPAR